MKNLFLFAGLLSVCTTSFSQGGELDLSFDEDGKTLIPAEFQDDLTSLAIQEDGKIIIAGAEQNFEDEFEAKFKITRLNEDGSLDETFGTDGIVIEDFGAALNLCTNVLIQTDGNIIVSGYTFASEDDPDFSLIRLTPDGTLDESFGDGGIVITSSADEGIPDGSFSSVLQNDGKILCLGIIETDENIELILHRYNLDGTLDDSFGEDGIITIIDDESLFSTSMEILSDADGNLFVGLSLFDIGLEISNILVLKMDSNGILDSDFGTGGITTTNIGDIAFSGLNTDDSFGDIEIQSDGKIVVFNVTVNNETGVFYTSLIRYNTDGSIDDSFGTDGVSIQETEDFLVAGKMALQNDDRILITGSKFDDIGGGQFLTRFDETGNLDETFGASGEVMVDFGGDVSLGKDIAIKEDMKIVVGATSQSGGFSQFAVAQYFPGIPFYASIVENTNTITSSTVFPNPSREIAQLIYTMSKEETVTIRMTDLNGRTILILADNEYRGKGQQNESIHLSNEISNGMYYISIESETGRQVIPFVKN